MPPTNVTRHAEDLPNRALECFERKVWFFDLDNTLYDAESELFLQIGKRMTLYVSKLLGVSLDEARMIQHRYFEDCGTTLCGLVRHHGIDPQSFLSFVQDVDYTVIAPDTKLREALLALQAHGHTLHIYTNADYPHVQRVLERLALTDIFPKDAVFDIFLGKMQPKPEASSLQHLLRTTGADPFNSLFIDDLPQNLVTAKHAGMVTVLRTPDVQGFCGASTNCVTDLIHASLDAATQR